MTRDIKQQVKESDLWPVAQTLQSNPKKSGTSWLFNCQKCGAKNKLNVTPAKKIFKCFSCGSGGKDPIKLLQEQKGLKYYDALKEVAEINNISLEAPQHIGEDSRTEPIETTFADLQLRSSGLFISQLSDRYVSASLDAQYDIVPGDDMVLKYLDVDGEPMTFSAPGKVRKKPLFRVRYQYPEHHKDKSGKPIKYRSPYGSGSALWIPNQLISDFAEEKEIDTLFITEGEKKADKLYRHGIPAVGIMGIHNFGYEKTMPRQFERIIKQCNVRKVVFLLDADYNTISTNPEKPVHLRPWSFFTAVSKFRHYFYAFNSSGIHLDILFGYHKDDQNKGIDDLIHRKYYNNEDQAIESLKKALELQALKHKEFEFHRITEKGDFQLKSYFHLDSPASFFNAHKKELAELGSFKYFRIQYKLNEKGEFEMAQKILPGEQYWENVKQPNKPSYVKFLYAECRNFLRNRNIGRFERDISQRLTINIDNKMVQEIDHVWVQNYLVDFTEQLQEPDVLEKLLSGINQYLGPQRLNNLYSIYPQFIEAEPDKQYMVFKTKYWEITADAVTEHDINTLPGDIWKNQIIDFDPKLQSPKNFLNIERIGDKWGIEACPELERFDWWNFMKNTSYFAWRENQSLTTEEETGRKFYVHKKEMTMDQLEELVNNLIPKVIATGFILHDYNNLSDMRAVLCVDGTESEVGKSEGGTGKSLFTKQFTYSRDTLGINGKKRDLESDPFIYDAAKQSTRVIYFDDCRIGMDFEHFFTNHKSRTRNQCKKWTQILHQDPSLCIQHQPRIQERFILLQASTVHHIILRLLQRAPESN